MKISPSILAADFANLERDIRRAVECDGGADYIHVDVMDGHFVPNLTIGPPVVAALAKVCAVPLDTHLMVDHPSRFVADFANAGASILTVHAEADDDLPLEQTLQLIRGAGMRVGLSIKPNTPVADVARYLPLLDLLLIMTVEPGYGNQKLLSGSLEKIAQARRLIDQINPCCDLEIDGGVHVGNVAECARAGANVIVMGTAIFGGQPATRIAEIRAALAE